MPRHATFESGERSSCAYVQGEGKPTWDCDHECLRDFSSVLMMAGALTPLAIRPQWIPALDARKAVQDATARVYPRVGNKGGNSAG